MRPSKRDGRGAPGSRLYSVALAACICAVGCVAQVSQEESGDLDFDDATAASTVSTAEAAASRPKATLIHEVRHSKTSWTRFWEYDNGPLIVESEGHIEKDGLPTHRERGTALEIFRRMNVGEPPAALVAAQERADIRELQIRENLRGRSLADLTQGPGPGREERLSSVAAQPSSRKFLGSQWWRDIACTGDYENHWQGDWWFRGVISCWDDEKAWVNSGAKSNTKGWEAMYWGVSSNVTYKHWWVGCTDYILFTLCDWENDTSTANQGFYRTWTSGGGIIDRAGEISTPGNNGGARFSLKYWTGSWHGFSPEPFP